VEQLREANLHLRPESIHWRQQANYYQSLHARAKAKLHEALGKIAALKAEVAQWVRRLFGRHSEKQQTDSTAPATPAPGKKARGQPPGKPGPARQKRPDLPVEKVVVARPEGTPVCDQCGLPYHHHGTARSHTEIVWEVRLFKRMVVRQQYQQACTCPRPGLPQQVTAEPPARLIERGLLSLESLVEALLRQYHYWMPIERLVAEWRELGVAISPGTWCGIFQK
jgi:transposase